MLESELKHEPKLCKWDTTEIFFYKPVTSQGVKFNTKTLRP